MDGFASLSKAVGDQISSDNPQLPVWKGFHPIADKLPQAIEQKKARKILGWPQDKKIVLFFGLIRKYKGLDLLIEAFSKTPLNHSKVILAIVGEAYESQKKYIKLIQKLDLNERIICDFNYANTQKLVKFLRRRCHCSNLYQCHTKWSNSPSLSFPYPAFGLQYPGALHPYSRRSDRNDY